MLRHRRRSHADPPRAELGCAGALVLPPFFFKNVPEAGVFAYYRQLIERVNNPTLRIVLYHIPAVSGVPSPCH